MSDPTATPRQDIEDDIAKVVSLVETAHRLLGEGRMVDLSALEDKVRGLCQAIKEAPQGTVAGLAERVAGVIADLDRLAAGLTEHHKQLSQRLDDDRKRPAGDAGEPKKD